MAVAVAPAQTTEVVLHSFGVTAPHGANPKGGVVSDSAGILYGNTTSGGKFAQGVVFKIYPSGHAMVLYNFPGGANGGQPSSGMVLDSAGNLYGTTAAGGASNAGTVYKVDPLGRQTVLHSFGGGDDGKLPIAGVIIDPAGNLFGATSEGGTFQHGTVYKVDTTGQKTVLYNFTGGADGSNPQTAVTLDGQGNFYGTTVLGGQSNLGAVFKLDPSGNETVLYSFANRARGTTPNSLMIDAAGNLYGTSYAGGAFYAPPGQGCGNVFKVDPSGKQTVLYNFTCGADGQNPDSAVVRDSQGNLYGTTANGGGSLLGVVYKLDPSGHQTVLHTFTGGADGSQPAGGLLLDSAGSLLGTAANGGMAGRGAVFMIDAAGQETTRYFFPASPGGQSPTTGLVSDSAGNLYGTTAVGGAYNAGVVYKISPTGQETLLHAFTGGADGGKPVAGLIFDSTGNLYGTTSTGGVSNMGLVFKMDTAGNESVVYTFANSANGAYPAGGVIFDPSGALYGITSGGGQHLCGTVFKLDPSGNQTVLHSFVGCLGYPDGAYPTGNLVRDAAGNLYGAAPSGGLANAGVVFKVDLSGTETVFYNFTGGADGDVPQGGLIVDSSGNLYGTTQGGGVGCGTVYRLDPSSNKTVLYSFQGGYAGCGPYAGVISDSAGNLYGTTYQGGASNQGTVYKLDPSNKETVLYNFTGGADGGNPESSVILDAAGNLYGATYAGGTEGTGVVFKIEP